jgi:alpha-glucosidase
MYPGVTPAIRGAIELRYRLLPYLYTLLWQAHADDEPMLRPTFLDHEHDAQTFAECDDFLLGRDLLVASVVEAGQRERRVWLPDNATGWYDFYTHAWLRAASGSSSTRRWKNCRCWCAPVPVCRLANASRM